MQIIQKLVSDSPTLQIKKDEDSANAISISCTVQSEPVSDISWLKEGVAIQDTDEDTMIVSKKQHSTLHLLQLGTEDIEGRYSCRAQNILGTIEDSVDISGKVSFYRET